MKNLANVKQRKIGSVIWFVIPLLWLLMVPTCSRTEKPVPNADQKALAIIGEDTITVFQFKKSYELAMLRSSQADSPENRRMHLQQMTDAYLLAQTARMEHLDTLAVFRYQREMAEREAMRELQFDRIREGIEVDENQLREAFRRSRESRVARHLYAKDRQAIEVLYRKLTSQGSTFEQLASEVFRDSTLQRNGGLLGWISWGDTDLQFENVLYQLQEGGISKPFQSKFGWHIVKLEAIRRDLIPSRLDYEHFCVKERPKLQRIYGEEKLAGYLSNYMRDQHLQLNVPLLRLVAAQIKSYYRDVLYPEDLQLQKIPANELGKISLRLSDLLQDTLIHYRGGEWTVADFVKRIPELPVQFVLYEMDKAVAFALRNDILAQKAYREGLDRRPEVRAQVRLRSNDWLARAETQLLFEDTPVERRANFTDEDVYLYRLQQWRKRRAEYLQDHRTQTAVRIFDDRLQELYR